MLEYFAKCKTVTSACREFEGKRGDREVEKIFGVLERVSELRDCGLPQLVERASGGEAAKLVGALQVKTNHSICNILIGLNLLVGLSVYG